MDDALRSVVKILDIHNWIEGGKQGSYFAAPTFWLSLH